MTGGRRGLALLALVVQLAVLLVWSSTQSTRPTPTPSTVVSAVLDRGVNLPDNTRVWPQHSIWRLQAQSIDGEMVELSKFAGRVALVVNVASK